MSNGCLTLWRRIGERILIGDNIVLTVVEITQRAGKVRIGIEAPREIEVDREEVRARKLEERANQHERNNDDD